MGGNRERVDVLSEPHLSFFSAESRISQSFFTPRAWACHHPCLSLPHTDGCLCKASGMHDLNYLSSPHLSSLFCGDSGEQQAGQEMAPAEPLPLERHLNAPIHEMGRRPAPQSGGSSPARTNLFFSPYPPLDQIGL